MQVKTLKLLIEKLQQQPKLNGGLFKSALMTEFPKLLVNLEDEDKLPLSFFQTKSNSIFLLNMYGVLFSMQKSCKTLNDNKLLQELENAIQEIHTEFPELKTAYSQKNASHNTKTCSFQF